MMPTRAERIRAFAQQAGDWPDGAVLAFTLDERNATEWASDAAFTEAMGEAGEICSLCHAARTPELSAAFIEQKRTKQQVCVALTDARAERDEATHIDSAPPVKDGNRAVWEARK